MIDKPKKCCYPDCFNCQYTECRYDTLERQDILRQDKFDKSLELVEPEIQIRRESQKRYNTTDKGKERFKRYANSDNGKERLKRYAQTDNFKESQRRYNSSDKGKERFRRYYLFLRRR